MNTGGAIGLLLMIIIFIVSLRGFNNHSYFDRYKFSVDQVLIYKRYYVLVTAGFLHVGWTHLIFNLISLLLFSGSVESMMGPLNMLLIFFASLVGGNLLALFIHKNDSSYSSVGASGAINGLLFAVIALFPSSSFGLFFLPISIPAWIFGLIYIIVSIYGIRSSRDNIGHDAHLGGALVGLILTSIMYPEAFLQNYITTLLLTVPVLVFLYILIKKPGILLVDNLFVKNREKYYTVDHRYNQQKADKQKRIDQILDKISSKGIKSLTREEKEFLEKNS